MGFCTVRVLILFFDFNGFFYVIIYMFVILCDLGFFLYFVLWGFCFLCRGCFGVDYFGFFSIKRFWLMF